jgi:hypothetical protein
MSTIIFDTLKFAERLEKAGFTREQSSAIAEAQKESLSEALETQLATKSDMSSIRTELATKSDMSFIRTELAVLKWMMGAMLGIGLTILFKLFS